MKKHPGSLFCAAAAVALVMGFATPVSAFDLQPVDGVQSQAVSSKSSGVSIQSHQIDGPTVQVVVESSTSESKLIVVNVLAVVNGQQVMGSTPVSLAPNGTVHVTVGFLGPVEGMITASILDQENPM